MNSVPSAPDLSVGLRLLHAPSMKGHLGQLVETESFKPMSLILPIKMLEQVMGLMLPSAVMNLVSVKGCWV